MKTALKYFLTAAAMLLTGIACSRFEQETAQEEVTIRAFLPEDETRAGGVVTDGVSWAWAEDDILTVTGENSEVFKIKEGFTRKKAEFTGKGVKGSKFSIAYPSSEDTDLSVQRQTGNNSMAHLAYRAVLEGVDMYSTFSFSPEWAAEHGGTLRQTGVLKLSLSLPDEVKEVSAIRISAETPLFYSGTSDKMTDNLILSLKDVSLSPGAALTCWMTTSWNEAPIPVGSVLTVTIQTKDKALSRDILIKKDVSLRSGVINTIKLDAYEWSEGGESLRYSGGKGTEAKPWIITRADQMEYIKEDLVPGVTRYYKLGADIDMTGIAWVPLNTAEPYDLRIDFDGDGHTISNLSCKAQRYPGLFGVLYGSCRNLNITGASIETSGATAAGIMAGYCGTADHPAEAVNVHVEGTVTNAYDVRGIGGLVGRLNFGTLKYCSAKAVVTNDGKESGVGGLCGWINGTIENCWAESTTTSKGNYAGGLFGFDNVKSSVSNCWTGGSVTCGQRAGGICGGLIKAQSSITNCYSLTTVKAGFLVAGIAGHCNLDKSNGNTTNEPGNVVARCIAWNQAIAATTKDNNAHYSSGAIVGYTALMNYLTDCYRKADLSFTECPSAAPYNILWDQENSTPASPLVENWNGTYNFPYHGKAAAKDATLSSVAINLGWDQDIWDLTGNIPKLKMP